MSGTGKVVFHLDDDETVLDFAKMVLEREGYTVFGFTDHRRFLSEMSRLQPSLILCDISLVDKDGFAVREMVRERYPRLRAPFVFLTVHRTPHDVARARAIGADYFVVKPFTPESLLKGIDAAFQASARKVRSIGQAGSTGSRPST